MGTGDDRSGAANEEPNTAFIRIGRVEVRGASANRLIKFVLCALGVLIVCVPGALAFFAYAEGGTSLWAALTFAVAVPGGIALWLVWDARRPAKGDAPSTFDNR